MYTRNIASLSSVLIGCYANAFTVAPSLHYHNCPLPWASAASSTFSSYVKRRGLTRNARERKSVDCADHAVVLMATEVWYGIAEFNVPLDTV